MIAQNPNIAIVELVVRELGEVCDQLVLVGGCVVGLLVTDLARPAVRATMDVDLIATVTTIPGYYGLQDQLKARGFKEAQDDGIMCRWTKGGLIIDVLPAVDIGQGFSNSWYPHAVRQATLLTLPSGGTIKVIDSPSFIATKLEAFHGRGDGDYAHHDIEDIVTVIDGRPETVDEIANSEPEIKAFIMQEIDDLLADQAFIDRLPWHLNPSEQSRVELLTMRFRKIAGL